MGLQIGEEEGMKLFRRKTIAKDGLSKVWNQRVHRAAMKDTLILLGLGFGISMILYLLFKRGM